MSGTMRYLKGNDGHSYIISSLNSNTQRNSPVHNKMVILINYMKYGRKKKKNVEIIGIIWLIPQMLPLLSREEILLIYEGYTESISKSKFS